MNCAKYFFNFKNVIKLDDLAKPGVIIAPRFLCIIQKMDRPRYSVDMGNLERNRTKELARKRSRKGKSHIGSSSQSRDDFDTGYARRDGDAMTDEQLEQELHRHNSRFFQDQPRSIDEEELEDEDDDVEEVIRRATTMRRRRVAAAVMPTNLPHPKQKMMILTY
ncbi:unnamed protein product [Cuscuta europaea]|uniref:Uncharacterized protein n=1 Tax=Cuscuta europaea TaxID=41803 RepID=A0A9P0YND3_CUSEU|nr:unnamed protein product [Cuscuta europaea]